MQLQFVHIVNTAGPYTAPVICRDSVLKELVERGVTGLMPQERQEGLAVASIAQDNPSGDDTFPRARMHRDRNAR